MKKILWMVIVALMTTMNSFAQKIQIVDNDGNGIPLVSVFSEDGLLIGTTDLDGVLADVKGATKVSLTHVAFKPQLVSVSNLQNGRIVMDDEEFGLEEIVVKPKPYVYMEFYFRGFSYIGDSLRVYTAGNFGSEASDVNDEIENKYKGKVRSVWSFGGAANKALTWNTQDLEYHAERGAKSSATSIETLVRKSEKFKDYYKVTMEEDGENRWLVKNPEGVLGHFFHDDGMYRATLDGA